MSAELQERKKHLEELQKFIGSRIHRGFVEARRQELADNEAAILLIDPIEPKDVAESQKLRGENRVLEELISTFEDTQRSLKARIDEMVEEENENAGNTKQ